MNVFLTTQVVSATVIRLINTCDNTRGGIKNYTPIRVLIKSIDYIFDMCNHIQVDSRGVVKECEDID